MNPTLVIEKTGYNCWVATMDIGGGVSMRAYGETLQQAFDKFQNLLVDGAIEHWGTCCQPKQEAA